MHEIPCNSMRYIVVGWTWCCVPVCKSQRNLAEGAMGVPIPQRMGLKKNNA